MTSSPQRGVSAGARDPDQPAGKAWPFSEPTSKQVGSLVAARRLRRTMEAFASRISPGLLTQPLQLMLLDLFIMEGLGRPVSVTSLCVASRVPASTAIRYIKLMEAHGLIARARHETDGRVILMELTANGNEIVEEVLRIFEPDQPT